MESNKDNYGQKEQQLRKRKFNELANAGQPAAAEAEQQQQAENLSKKNCGGQQENDALEVCTLVLK
jgi:transposase-like protein